MQLPLSFPATGWTSDYREIWNNSNNGIVFIIVWMHSQNKPNTYTGKIRYYSRGRGEESKNMDNRTARKLPPPPPTIIQLYASNTPTFRPWLPDKKQRNNRKRCTREENFYGVSTRGNKYQLIFVPRMMNAIFSTCDRSPPSESIVGYLTVY